MFVGQDRVSARGLRTGKDPGLRLMDLSGGTGASALDPAASGTKGFGRRNRQSGNRDFGSESAKRRTARASALTGSPRGNRIELRLLSDSGGSGAWACPGFRHSKPPGAKGLAFQARSDAKGQWGLAARSAPIIFGGRLAARSASIFDQKGLDWARSARIIVSGYRVASRCVNGRAAKRPCGARRAAAPFHGRLVEW